MSCLHRGPYIQRGRGFGSTLNTMFKGVVPIMRVVGRDLYNAPLTQAVLNTAKRSALEAGLNVANDVLEGKNVKDSLKGNLNEVNRKVTDSLTSAMKNVNRRHYDSSDEDEPRAASPTQAIETASSKPKAKRKQRQQKKKTKAKRVRVTATAASAPRGGKKAVGGYGKRQWDLFDDDD